MGASVETSFVSLHLGSYTEVRSLAWEVESTSVDIPFVAGGFQGSADDRGHPLRSESYTERRSEHAAGPSTLGGGGHMESGGTGIKG